jgi:hypothetical protein
VIDPEKDEECDCGRRAAAGVELDRLCIELLVERAKRAWCIAMPLRTPATLDIDCGGAIEPALTEYDGG